MKLDEFFKRCPDELPEQGAEGKESDWLFYCNVPVSGEEVWVGDPLMAWAEANSKDGCLVKLSSGNYRFEAKVMEYEKKQFISRVRLLKETSNPIIGKMLEEACTDSALIAITDQSSLHESFVRSFDNEFDPCIELVHEQTSSPIGIVKPQSESEAVMPYTPSGFGDGAYPVFELIEGKDLVGIEVVLLTESESMRCPVETCSGWVTGNEDDEWCCDDCGYEWDSLDELGEAIEEIIETHQHRAACYSFVDDQWIAAPKDHEPSDYEFLVKSELD